MNVSRILGVVSFAVVVGALVSVVMSWSDSADDPSSDATLSGLVTTTSGDVGGAVLDSSTTVAPTSDSSTVPAPATTAPAAPTGPRSATLVITGDVIPSDRMGSLARYYGDDSGTAADFGPMFERVAGLIEQADVAICHLGGTVGTAASAEGGVAPAASAALAEAIAASGWDSCSLAAAASSAPADDLEVAAATFEELGLVAAGVGGAAMIEAGSISLGHLAYADPTSTAGPAVDTVVQEALAAADAGAEFVVVSVWWDDPFADAPGAEQEAFVEQLAASGAVDVLVGHGTHRVQGIEQRDDMWVVHSLGNFLTSQSPGCCGVEAEDGVVLQLAIEDEGTGDGPRVAAVEFTPTWVDRVLMQVMPVDERLGDQGLEAWYRAVLRNSWNRTARTLGATDNPIVTPAAELP